MKIVGASDRSCHDGHRDDQHHIRHCQYFRDENEYDRSNRGHLTQSGIGFDHGCVVVTVNGRDGRVNRDARAPLSAIGRVDGAAQDESDRGLDYCCQSARRSYQSCYR